MSHKYICTAISNIFLMEKVQILKICIMWKKDISILLFSLSFVTLILAENISTDDYDHQTKVEKEGKIRKTSNKKPYNRYLK